jgi:hypothetical protein
VQVNNFRYILERGRFWHTEKGSDQLVGRGLWSFQAQHCQYASPSSHLWPFGSIQLRTRFAAMSNHQGVNSISFIHSCLFAYSHNRQDLQSPWHPISFYSISRRWSNFEITHNSVWTRLPPDNRLLYTNKCAKDALRIMQYGLNATRIARKTITQASVDHVYESRDKKVIEIWLRKHTDGTNAATCAICELMNSVSLRYKFDLVSGVCSWSRSAEILVCVRRSNRFCLRMDQLSGLFRVL